MFDLPSDQLRYGPSLTRGQARLLVLHRDSGRIEHRAFSDIAEYLGGWAVYINDSGLRPGWIRLWQPPGYEARAYLVERLAEHTWSAYLELNKGSKPDRVFTRAGKPVRIEHSGRRPYEWRLEFEVEPDLEQEGCYRVPSDWSPIPDISSRPLVQAIYAKNRGSFAAPTAGIHFTEETLEGLDIRRLTLHTGPWTFYGVESERPEDHPVHPEYYHIPEAPKKGERVAAVGTTVVKALESWARTGRVEDHSHLYIFPPFEFKTTGALLTNLHRPRETLLMLTCAFGGFETVMKAHREAARTGYCFSYYGDLMLIL
jgi:S-adenosylmethionine:tRNA ribosyltransferase-isomerase